MDYGLIGGRLSYSFSPFIHARLGDYDYQLKEIGPEAVEDFLLHGDYRGLNVTNPYKEVAYRLCDELDPVAERTASVNTLLKKEGRLYGYNTDYFGFDILFRGAEETLEPAPEFVILGNGATAKMVATYLKEKGYDEVHQLSRHGEVPFNDLEILARGTHLIHCTPVGMSPHVEERLPLDFGDMPRLRAVLDLNYNPLITPLCLRAQLETGNPDLYTASGFDMLVAQAWRSAEIFGYPNDYGLMGEIAGSLKNQLKNIVLLESEDLIEDFRRVFGYHPSTLSDAVAYLARETHRDVLDLRGADRNFIRDRLLEFSRILILSPGDCDLISLQKALCYNSLTVPALWNGEVSL